MKKIILIILLFASSLLSQTDEQKKQYAKYDFVACDKIIFEDNQFAETQGNFPSRWKLEQGTAENSKSSGGFIHLIHDGLPRNFNACLELA